jgi:uncharacterized protein YdhG (YjbR/CyaY superfamily)
MIMYEESRGLREEAVVNYFKVPARHTKMYPKVSGLSHNERNNNKNNKICPCA